MATQKVITDIPDDDVDEVVEDFNSEGCNARKEKQADGNWKVVATCPDA